jgi:hypothetical protein
MRTAQRRIQVPKFVIEREMPNVGKLSAGEMQKAAHGSAGVMADIGKIHWVQTYVADDKLYCVYVAPDEQAIREHARKTGLPASRISRIHGVVDASTGE